MRSRFVWALCALALSAGVAGFAVASGNGASGPTNVVLLYNGPAIANTHAAPGTAAFSAWCSSAGPCAPSVALPVSDTETGQARGTIYVWTKNFATSGDGKTLCFGEFIWYALNDGDLYTHSGANGTCGAFMDPALKPPTHVAGPAQVVGGGGDGTIVGGSGRYAHWTGSYTDRVFVELSFSAAPNYYDQLFFSIDPD